VGPDNYTVQSIVEYAEGGEWKSVYIGGGLAEQEVPGKLNGISCGAATACMAVGHYVASTGIETALADVRKGSPWSTTTVPVPPGSTHATALHGVSFLAEGSFTSCAAAGGWATKKFAEAGFHAPEKERTLVEGWGGSNWVVQESPNPEGGPWWSTYADVSCTVPLSCGAVGSTRGKFGIGEGLTLAAHRTGTVWSE
jgi:hypothetical protein